MRRSPLELKVRPVTYEANLLSDYEDNRLLTAASPARTKLEDAPPFLLVHGDSDKIVPTDQATLMHLALARASRSSTLVRLAGAGHEDPAFDGGPVLALTAAWLREHLSASSDGLANPASRSRRSEHAEVNAD